MSRQEETSGAGRGFQRALDAGLSLLQRAGGASTRLSIFALAASTLLVSPLDVRAEGGRVLAEMDCPAEEPFGMTAREGHLWISDLHARTILELDIEHQRVLRRLEAPGLMPTGLDWHDGVLYSADRRRDWIARRRPDAETDLSPIPYYERWASGIAHDGTSLWVVDGRSHQIHRLDPQDGTTIESFPTPGNAPTGLAFDGEYLWIADHGTDELYRIDRRDGTVITILPSPGPYPSALAWDDGTLWVADYQTGKLTRIEAPGSVPYVEDQERRVEISYEVVYRATGSGRIEGLTVSLALPRDIPGQHVLGELTFDPEPERFETDRWGQRVAIVRIGRLDSGQTKSVSWRGRFAIYRTRFHIVPSVVDQGEIPEEVRQYLQDDRKYDLSSKTVGDLVERLTAGETSRYRKARLIYEHLAEVITYDRSSGWNNAATVLERGTGSCSEYTFALVALLRRAGIPARYVGAVSERGDEASFDDVFHRWAEAYFPGYGWVPIDANAAHGQPPGVRGAHFAGRSNRQLVTTIGGGASEYLRWTYNSDETYETVGSVELEVRPIARFRPIEDARAVEPHRAQGVLVPTIETPPQEDRAEAEAEHPSGSTSPLWLAAFGVVLGTALGLALSGWLRRS